MCPSTQLHGHLGKVTNDPEANMVYAKYKLDIVDCHQVIIEGWLLATFESPSKNGSMKELEQLAAALESTSEDGPSCKFWALNNKEYATHKMDRTAKADQVCIRKEQSDKGVAHGPYKCHENTEVGQGASGGKADCSQKGEKQKKGKENEGSWKMKKDSHKREEQENCVTAAT